MNGPLTQRASWEVPQLSSDLVDSFKRYIEREQKVRRADVHPLSFSIRGSTASSHSFSHELLDRYRNCAVSVSYVVRRYKGEPTY